MILDFICIVYLIFITAYFNHKRITKEDLENEYSKGFADGVRSVNPFYEVSEDE